MVQRDGRSVDFGHLGRRYKQRRISLNLSEGLGNLVPDLVVIILALTVDAATVKADGRGIFCILFIDFDLHSVWLA